MPSASYFDVDGTLLRTNLIHPTVYYLLNQRTPFRSFLKVAKAVARAPEMAIAEWKDRRLFNEALFSSYEGMSQDRLLLLADDAFETVVERALYPAAGPEKARLIREHARTRNLDLGDCFAYSDSYSDVPMLSVVGHPAAVNPDGKLSRLADAYGWPVIHLDTKKKAS